jgi:hypothetical protein
MRVRERADVFVPATTGTFSGKGLVGRFWADKPVAADLMAGGVHLDDLGAGCTVSPPKPQVSGIVVGAPFVMTAVELMPTTSIPFQNEVTPPDQASALTRVSNEARAFQPRHQLLAVGLSLHSAGCSRPSTPHWSWDRPVPGPASQSTRRYFTLPFGLAVRAVSGHSSVAAEDAVASVLSSVSYLASSAGSLLRWCPERLRKKPSISTRSLLLRSSSLLDRRTALKPVHPPGSGHLIHLAGSGTDGSTVSNGRTKSLTVDSR